MKSSPSSPSARRSKAAPARRGMPSGIRIFLVYGFLILAIIGLSLNWVVQQAVAMPVSPIGVVTMVLLAYTIFTMTLVFQRKEAARGLALGLATLTLPAIPLAWLSFIQTGPRIAATLFVLAFALLLFRGLLAPEVRSYLDEP
jgi:hypothetical protein